MKKTMYLRNRQIFLIALSSQKNWKLNAIDIKTAFLKGQSIIRNIYVVPPKEAKASSIWKLEKWIYGLPC